MASESATGGCRSHWQQADCLGHTLAGKSFHKRRRRTESTTVRSMCKTPMHGIRTGVRGGSMD